MIGTTIFDTDGNQSNSPKHLPPKDVSVEQLVGGADHSSTMTLAIWTCDTTTDDGCLHPREGQITIKSFREMVREKMFAISDKIAARQPHENLSQTMAFLNVTDLPVYKMLAVSTSLSNTALADSLISRYQDLIAAKYAEVYIQLAVKDIQAALTAYASATSSNIASDVIKELQPQLGSLQANARAVLSKAYSQTISTYSIAQELQYMERAMNANLSQTLRNSLAFGRSIR